MTRWRAVGVGFALAASSEALVFAMTGRVTLIGGLAGSALAGYVAGEDPAEGAWHGLLTALSWGIVLIPVGVLVTLTRTTGLPFPLEFVLPYTRTPGDVTTAMLLLVTLPNVLTGAAGSLVRVSHGPAAWMPEDWA